MSQRSDYIEMLTRTEAAKKEDKRSTPLSVAAGLHKAMVNESNLSPSNAEGFADAWLRPLLMPSRARRRIKEMATPDYLRRNSLLNGL